MLKIPDRAVFDITRRDFCRIASGCAMAAVVLPACMEGDGRVVGTGPLSGGGGPGNPNPTGPDAGDPPKPGQPDAGTPVSTPDAAPTGPGPACSGSPIDVGMPSSFQLNTATYFSSGGFFVVRDSGGLYAMSAACTHDGVTVRQQGNEMYCPAHGATFSLNGDPLGGPVFRGLTHYSVCYLPSGHLAVNRSQSVSSSTRVQG